MLFKLTRAARRRVPKRIKRGFRASQTQLILVGLRFRALRRGRVLRRSLEALRTLDSSAPVPRVLLEQLSYGWGNEKYAAGPEYLAAAIEAARRTPGRILECGCGLSTLVLGIEASRSGTEVVTLEHDSYWAKRMRRTLERHRIECVTVLHAPLRSYGSFIWYDVRRGELSSGFSLVICDGPPAELGGRYGLLPVAHRRLQADAEVLLDDVARDGERAVLTRWKNEFGVTSTIEPVEKPFARLCVPRSRVTV